MSGSVGDAPAHAGFDPELRVDWVDADVFGDGRPGRLGMTFLPGKRGASSRYPGHVYRRVLADDLAELHARRLALLVLLVEDVELERWGELAFGERAAAAGVPLLRLPIADGAPPHSAEELNGLLDRIDEARTHGDVAVACLGGVGRSGTVVAAALMAAGHKLEDALSIVRRIRHPQAVETPAQHRFLEGYAPRAASRHEAHET